MSHFSLLYITLTLNPEVESTPFSLPFGAHLPLSNARLVVIQELSKDFLSISLCHYFLHQHQLPETLGAGSCFVLCLPLSSIQLNQPTLPHHHPPPCPPLLSLSSATRVHPSSPLGHGYHLSSKVRHGKDCCFRFDYSPPNCSCGWRSPCLGPHTHSRIGIPDSERIRTFF